MDNESGGVTNKPAEIGSETINKTKRSYFYWWLLVLRFLALIATVLATLIMSLNEQSKNIVIATIGTRPIQATVTAKFQNTPAFVFFVVVNSIASFHNLLMLLVALTAYKFGGFTGTKLLIMTSLDMANVALVSVGTGAATSMAELGKKGNSHAQWNKICDKFGKYCDRGAGALIVSFVGILLLMALNVMSTIAIHKNVRTPSSTVI